MSEQRDFTRPTTRAMVAIHDFLEAWAKRGTAGLAPAAVVRLRTFNLVTLGVGTLGLIHLVWFVFLGREWTLLAWLRVPALLWYVAIPFIVSRQRRPFAQIGTLLIANANLTAAAVATGRQTGLHTLLFALVTFPLLIFEPQQRWLLALTMALPLVARLSFEVLAGPVAFGRWPVFYFILIVQTFVLLSLPVLAFVREMLRYQHALENASSALRLEHGLRAKAEAELEIARRTEAMARLAGGIAHEINTPLQYISNNVGFAATSSQQLMGLVDRLEALIEAACNHKAATDIAATAARAKQEADLDYIREELPRALEHAVDGLDRLGEIVRSMKELSHPTQRDMAKVDLNQLIRNVLVVARSEYDHVADANAELGEIPGVMCHAGEIGQVLLNLLVNAGHAVAQRFESTATRGLITVRSQRDGEAVLISVEDTGAGIPEAIADRIFEPFFTTKPVGKGTGQGLAISHTIVVRRHRGTLTFHSEPGRGTTFQVRLPIEQVRGADVSATSSAQVSSPA